MSALLEFNPLIVGALIGLGFGIFLQKGRFCFVSAFRDFIAYKDGRMLKGVIFGILTMMLGVNVALGLGTPLDHLWVPYFGLNSIIGGFIFGLGMTFAGGCASGTLYRAGEGYIHFWITLIFTGISYVVFAILFKDVFLPYYYQPLQIFQGFSPFTLNPTIASIIPFVVVGVTALIWTILRVHSKPRDSKPVVSNDDDDDDKEVSAPKNLLKLLKDPWDSKICGLAIGLVATFWFAVSTTWSVTAPEARWTGYLLSLAPGTSAVDGSFYWSNVIFGTEGIRITSDMVMLAFLIVGSFLAALWSGDFKIRIPTRRSIPNSIIGGILMGFGSRMAPGCNISNTFSGLAILSMPGAVATLGLVLGVYAATHYLFRDVGCAI